VESIEQGDSGSDENCAHDDGAENSPEQDLVLQVGGNLEISEDEEENEKIVDTESFFDQVASYEFERELTVGMRQVSGHTMAVEVQQDGESAGKGDPKRGPTEGLAHADGVRLAIEYAEVEHQHYDHEGYEQYPEQ